MLADGHEMTVRDKLLLALSLGASADIVRYRDELLTELGQPIYADKYLAYEYEWAELANKPSI